ncbi:MAX gene-associated protein-like [Lampris incognitus]|uniref:MAX gene-associated protein-like n=1 Tax=Lampris incognitus TaxID=2546036 RepID=UPI0024B4B987|nr:MAX gene-associated protein-like [Lampris incognitus]
MATKKTLEMVLLEDGVTPPTALPAAASPPARSVTLKPGKASEGGLEHGSTIISKKEVLKVSATLPTRKLPAKVNSDNLPADSTCKGVKVTLDNNGMWNEFFRCQTEMILTNQGSRMFPYCRFRISDLEPTRQYSLFLDIQPVDNSQYCWTGQSWQVAGKADSHVKSQLFVHPDSPAAGRHWMQNPVSFYKLKLTNNLSDKEGNIILHALQRYLPRLHVIPSDKSPKDLKLDGPHVVTFTFPQTEFFAVTAYQNPQFSKLKVDYNPFTKGLKEEGSTSFSLKLKSATSKDSYKEENSASEQHPLRRNLKSLLENHKPRSSKSLDQKTSMVDDQKTTAADKVNSATKATEESSRSSEQPAQKLFSELIREAHVSLRRCNVEKMCINNSTLCRVNLTDIMRTAIKPKGNDAEKDSLPPESPSAKMREKVSRNIDLRSSKQDNDLPIMTDSTTASHKPQAAFVSVSKVLLNSPVISECRTNPESSTEEKVNPPKRPSPGPLPALALFLKQHQLKSRQLKTRPKSLTELKNESPVSSAHFSEAPASHTREPSDPAEITKPGSQAACPASSNHSVSQVSPTVDHAVDVECLGPGPSGQPAVPTAEQQVHGTDLVPVPDLLLPDGAPESPRSAQPCNIPEQTSTISSPTDPSSSPMFSPAHLAELAPPNAPESVIVSPSLSESNHGPSLPQSDCSSFCFEPLPSPPVSVPLDSHPAYSDPTSKVSPPGQLNIDGPGSVLKWHTVLPPPESYLSTFTPFQPSPQPPSSSTQTSRPPLCLSPTFLNQEVIDTAAASPSSDPATSFQDNDQSFPFPAELSPLALQLSLSPTFSSLDGDVLSPAPSITDLMHFFSNDEDLAMEVDFSNTEPVPCPQGPSLQAQLLPINKPQKSRKKGSRARPGKMDAKRAKTMDTSMDSSMQPSLEEVEEQLFVSFTSKEALKLHLGDLSDVPAVTSQLQQSTEATENGSLEERLAGFEKVLLRDLKHMKNKQVIHPVLQEVGLKLNLLDPTLTIDLQYLGVRLPIPPPGDTMELPPEALTPSQSVSTAFMSRTGKTTDVTQIKGWRDKFSPPELSSTPSSKCEAGPSSEPTSKNLSAFCSDMLDQYLENEGKLIDERAASFSQAAMEPVTYELPTTSTSYVRTLDNVLKKQLPTSPTSALISGFIPPSKRPRLSPMGTRKSKQGEKKQKVACSKPNKYKPGSVISPVSTPTPNPAATISAPNQPTAEPPALLKTPSDPALKVKKNKLSNTKTETAISPLDLITPINHTPKDTALKSKKLKAQTQDHSALKASPPAILEDMSPLESDSELGPFANSRAHARPVMTRALLKQKDLEDGVVWEGRLKTCVTEERAAIALTSLFTLGGFVRENPTAPIQLIKRRAPPCLNDFCRLGCVCASLAQSRRVTHCGKDQCIFGCSCLRQKVVLLKNLEGSDSSPTDGGKFKKRRKKRMKMAYVLRESENFSQPAQQVKTLWMKIDPDPEPIYVPEPVYLPSLTSGKVGTWSCARVRGYHGRMTHQHKRSPSTEKESEVQCKPEKNKTPLRKKTKVKQSTPPGSRQLNLSEPKTRTVQPPSKRLLIMAECRWKNSADRNLVLQQVCEAMAKDQLQKPFKIKGYHITPLCQYMEPEEKNVCVYKVRISGPNPGRNTPFPLKKTDQLGEKTVVAEEEGKEGSRERGEPLEDWQREVEEDFEEDEEDEQRETSEDAMKSRREKTGLMKMGLPFLTSISPAGFLSANLKQPGGTNLLVQVNSKPYPLAKIQLGEMGALHPANRLAAYLTGRVGSAKQQRAPVPTSTLSSTITSTSTSTSSSPQQPAISQGSTLTSQSVPSSLTTAASVAKPKVTVINLPPSSTAAVTQVNSGLVSFVKSSLGSALPSKPQMLMVSVPDTSGSVPIPGLPTNPTAPPSAVQRMFLQPVRTISGNQLYRKQDGKLVQLVPVSQLKGVSQGQSVPTTPSISRLKVVSARPLTAGTGFLGQKSTCTLKIIPNSNGKPLMITCPKVPVQNQIVPMPGSFTLLQPPHPPNTNLIALKPSGVQGAKPGVKTVTVSSVGPTSMGAADISKLVCNKLTQAVAPNQTESSSGTPPKPPVDLPGQPGQQGRLVSRRDLPSSLHPSIDLTAPVSPEMASNQSQLDIICVDDEAEPPDDGAGGAQSTTGWPTLNRNQRKEAEVVDLVEDSSGETENSSDFQNDSDDNSHYSLAVGISKSIHNALEQTRRKKLLRRFQVLREEVGLSSGKMSQIAILKKAQQEILALRKMRRDLKQKKQLLKKERAERVRAVSQMTGERKDIVYRKLQRHSTDTTTQFDLEVSGPSKLVKETQGDQLLLDREGRKPRVEANVMEVLDLLEETDEQTDNSSDECVSAKKDTIKISSDDDDNVDIETVEDCNLMNLAQRRLTVMTTNLNSDPGLPVKDSSQHRLADKFKAVKAALNLEAKGVSKCSLIKLARKKINMLRDEGEKLEKLKSNLMQQRATYIKDISTRSGKSQLKILRKLQFLAAKQRRLEKDQRRCNAARSPPGGESNAAQSTALPQPTTERPPQEEHPAHLQAQQTAQQSHTNLQPMMRVPAPILTSSIVSQNASTIWDQPKTVPNIPSHKKNPQVPPAGATVQAEVLSLVGTALPGQQVLPLGPLSTVPTMLQSATTPGVASVTLSISSLANQHIQLTSLPHATPGQVFSTAALLTAPKANLAAPSFPSVLHLVQPTLQPQTAAATRTPDVPPQPFTQNQVPDLLQVQDSAHSQYQLLTPGDPVPWDPGAESPASSEQRAESGAILPAVQPPEKMEHFLEEKEMMGGKEVAGDREGEEESSFEESLTSLLNELVFLNQHICNTDELSTGVSFLGGPEEFIGGAEEEKELGKKPNHSQPVSPLPQEQDEDWSRSTTEEVVVLNCHAQTGHLQNPQCTAKPGAPTLPPLLQMKVGEGGAKGEESTNERTGGNGRGLTWRPMPRLVPLGLKTNPQV